MDGADVRGYKVYVERAKFEKKGTFDPNLAKKKKLSNKQKRKLKEKQEKYVAVYQYWNHDEVLYVAEDYWDCNLDSTAVLQNRLHPLLSNLTVTFNPFTAKYLNVYVVLNSEYFNK